MKSNKVLQFKLKPSYNAMAIALITAMPITSYAYTDGNAGNTQTITKANGSLAQITNCIVDLTDNNIVCGKNATANQNNSVVIGENAQSSGLSDDASNPEKLGKSNTVAIGTKSNATGFESTSIGSYSKTATRATALGHNAQANGNYSIANGYNAVANRNHTIAIGSGASVLMNATADTNVSNNKTVNINGAASETESVGAIALGRMATAAGYGAMAFGLNAKSPAAYSHVFGSNSSANRYGSLALGGYSSSNSELGVALGTYSHADREGGGTNGADPLGVGDSGNTNNRSWVSNAGAVSVGSSTARNYAASVDIPATSRQIINVAAGSLDSDAVNVAQLKAAGYQLNTQNDGGELTIKTTDNAGNPLTSANDNKIQNGEQLIAGAGKNIHLTQTGNRLSIATKDDVTFKSVTIENGPKLDSNGINMNDKTISNVADGVADKDAVNVRQLNAVKTDVTNQGNRITNLETNLGNANTNIQNLTNQTWKLQVNDNTATNSAVKSTDTISMNAGNNIQITKSYDTATNTYKVNVATSDNVNFTSANIGGIQTSASGINMNAKTITNLADGVNDTDAVNVRQLNAAKNTVSAGSNIQVSQTTNSNGSINYQISTNSLITSTGNTQVTDNGVKVGNVTVSNTGINAANNKIVGVQDGEVSATSKEAVNGSQLYQAINNMSGNVLNTIDTRVNELGSRVEQVEMESKEGIAASMAIAGLTQAYLPGKNMISVAGSTYHGHTGYAIGVSSISDSGNWIVKGTVAGSTRKGRIGATAGVGYQW